MALHTTYIDKVRSRGSIANCSKSTLQTINVKQPNRVSIMDWGGEFQGDKIHHIHHNVKWQWSQGPLPLFIRLRFAGLCLSIMPALISSLKMVALQIAKQMRYYVQDKFLLLKGNVTRLTQGSSADHIMLSLGNCLASGHHSRLWSWKSDWVNNSVIAGLQVHCCGVLKSAANIAKQMGPLRR